MSAAAAQNRRWRWRETRQRRDDRSLIVARVTIVDYGLANIRSVVNAFEYFGAEVELAKDGDALLKAERIVLPGVGIVRCRHARLARARPRGRACAKRCSSAAFLISGFASACSSCCRARKRAIEPGLELLPRPCAESSRTARASRKCRISAGTSSYSAAKAACCGSDRSPDFYFVHSYFVPAEGETKDARDRYLRLRAAFRRGA